MFDALALSFLAQVAPVAVDVTEPLGCPSSGQLIEALRAHVPEALVPIERARQAGALIVRLEPVAPGDPPRFVVVDVEGRVRLRRTLRAPDASGGGDCPVLAETVALIVDRYLQGVAAPEESSATVGRAGQAVAARLWRMELAGHWNIGRSGGLGINGALRVGRLFGARERFVAHLGLGFSGSSNADLVGGSGAARAFPAVFGIGYRFPAGPVSFELGALAQGELWVVRTDVGGAQSDFWRIPVSLGGAAEFVLPWGRYFFTAQGLLLGALNAVDFAQGIDAPVFQAPRLQGKLGLGGGVLF